MTHEIAKRLIQNKNYEITLFTSQFPGGLPRETMDSINIVRHGGKYTVYRQAKIYYKKNNTNYDLVIDEINARPFLTPKYVNEKPILTLFHHMVKEQWFYESHFPLNFIGYYYLERKWLSYYIDIPTITVSDSSKKDLEDAGFKKIFLVKEGLNITPLSELPEKERSPTILFLGRLIKYKLPDHALEAFYFIKRDMPNIKMRIIGNGYMKKKLEEKYKDKNIIFHGHVSDELKYLLLSRAHLVLVPSVREGWGLVVTESNAMGTPVVAYNVPGLKDSVLDGKTGIITKRNTPDSLASCIVALFKQPDLLTKYGLNALNYSKQFNWDNTAEEFDRIIQSII